MSPAVYTLSRGFAPLLVSLPHTGTALPDSLRPRLTARALALEDTDWHLETLYAFARELGASVIVPHWSRYLIDLNRPLADEAMYPGRNNTELCPTRSFGGEPLYRPGEAPGEDEIAQRRVRYWTPYHDALAAELARLHAQFGYALLWDGHSIRSVLPWLFEGQLPALNLGTVNGQSCAPSLRAALSAALASQTRYDHVTDGRFRGGYITRQYGQPALGYHAVQLEMAWHCYMDEAPPHVLDRARAAALIPVLRRLLETMLGWRPDA